MKVRTALLCAAVLVTAFSAPLTYAKGIRTDTGTTLENCTTVSPIDAFAASVNPNAGVPITSECNSTSGNDQALGTPFVPGDNAYSNANFYDWGSAPPVAQVADYTLSTGDESANSFSLSGLTEIEFNYADTTCTGIGPAELTLGGVHYSASCVSTFNASLLFDGTVLVGWLNNSNDDHACVGGVNCLAGSGWSTASSTVPEPGSFALFGLAALLLVIRLRRRMTHVLYRL